MLLHVGVLDDLSKRLAEVAHVVEELARLLVEVPSQVPAQGVVRYHHNECKKKHTNHHKLANDAATRAYVEHTCGETCSETGNLSLPPPSRPPSQRAHLPPSLPASLPASLPPYLPTYLPTYHPPPHPPDDDDEADEEEEE